MSADRSGRYTMNIGRGWWAAAAALALLPAARAWNANEVDFPGEGNGWADPSTLNDTAKYRGPDGSPEWFRYTLLSAADNADFDFKMILGNNWANDLGGNTAFAKNSVDILYWNPLGDTPAKLSGAVSNGFRYVFTAKDPGLSANAYISVMELSAAPVLIDNASGPQGTVGSNDLLQFTVYFKTNLPPEQKAFVRLSTNNFASWWIREAAVSGAVATLAFTNEAPSSATTKWYAFASTGASNVLAGMNGFGVDAMTLTWANNGGSNYAYRTNPKEAAFVFHNHNRVVQGARVSFWAKTGHANADGSGRWVSNACLYYTTNGVDPQGSRGVPGNASTFAAPMLFDHIEQDADVIGEAMWWQASVDGLPGYTPIRYKIGAWTDADHPERFADYQAGTNDLIFAFQLGTLSEPDLTVNGLNADYTTTKLFLDETAGDARELVVVYKPGVSNVVRAEVFSNVGRRDYVEADYNADGIPDGIRPPDGNTITAADTGAYFRAWAMAERAPGEFAWTTRVDKCGAYRLTARHQTAGNTNWTWYSSGGRRDHAIVATPEKAHRQTMYELNTLTVEAQGANEGGRSTFKDLLGAAEGDGDGYDPFNLAYLNFLQVNCLWFQPIHPNGIERAEIDPATGSAYQPGSPYATKNYFWVGGAFGEGYSEVNAMAEFTNFVRACDVNTGAVGTINVMLDGVFNHTSWDAVFGQGAVDLGLRRSIGDTNSPVVAAGDRLGQYRPYWYADGGAYGFGCSAGEGYASYGDEADCWHSAYDNDFAVAPDRGDFGKWNDVAELYFGRYAALVSRNPQDNGNYLNEGDGYDYGSQTAGVIELWKLFGYYPEFWLRRTGHPGTNSFALAQDDLGIDGLRCDFGQGLPPQLWEYIINRTRSKKWNFLFMAETLDGGVPGYRSNRHFDVLNENLVFQFTQAKVNNSWEVRSALESRRSAYNGGAILLNLTSHDEVLPDSDPWVVVSRYGALSSVDGIPMIFYGQEKGIKNYEANPARGYDDGFGHHELNFGKYVPHFKRWNQLTVWFSPPPDASGLDLIYARINYARHASPALRSVNRYFLTRMAGGDHAQILAVAKYETPAAPPRERDVVLAFANLLRHGQPHSLAADTYDLRPAWSQLGLDLNRQYAVRNLAASDASALLPGWPRTGRDLYTNGVFVSLHGGTQGSIAADGALVQYLKLEEVDDYDQDGLPVDFELAGGLDPTDGTGANGANGDPDHDGFSNAQEYIAGTHPNLATSRHEITGAAALAAGRRITVPTQPGRHYTIRFADGTVTNGMAWAPFANTNVGIGAWRETNGSASLHTFVDDETTNTTAAPPVGGQRIYRVDVVKP